jgi:Protein of unknown function (DUF3617)
MTLTARIAFIVLPFAMTAWLHGQITMRAGLWENTVTASGQTVKRNSCITPEQEQQSKASVDSMRKSTEKSLAKTGACKLKEFTVTGGTQTMVMVCGETSIKHVTTFHTDSFETTATATTPKGVKVSLIKGRRIGECPAGGVE